MFNHIHTNQPVTLGDVARITSSAGDGFEYPSSRVGVPNAISLLLLDELQSDFLGVEKHRFVGSTRAEILERLRLWIESKRAKVLTDSMAPAHSNLMPTGSKSIRSSVQAAGGDFRRDDRPRTSSTVRQLMPTDKLKIETTHAYHLIHPGLNDLDRALLLAAEAGNDEECAELLGQGAEVDRPGKVCCFLIVTGFLHHHLAMSTSSHPAGSRARAPGVAQVYITSIYSLRALPDSHPHLPCFQDKKTPLHIGAQLGYEAVCRALVFFKADVNAQDKVRICRVFVVLKHALPSL